MPPVRYLPKVRSSLLMADDVDKRAIIKGINNSVAARIAKLAGSAPLEEKVFADGGPASNRGLVEALEDALLCDIEVTRFPAVHRGPGRHSV